MTNFIDCYSSLEPRILNIKTSKLFNSTAEKDNRNCWIQNFNDFRSRIISVVSKAKLNYITIQENCQKGVVEVNGLYDPLFDLGFDIFCKVKFLFHTNQITIFSSLLKNAIPLKIKYKAHRLSVNKLILKINSTIKYGSFRLDPNNGELTIALNSCMTYAQFQAIKQKPHQIISYLENQFIKSKYYYKTYISKILYIINQMPFNFCMNTEPISNKILLRNPKSIQILQTLYKILPTIHLEHPFMFADNIYSGSKSLTVQQARKQIQAIKISKSLRKPILPQIQNIIKYFCKVKKNNKAQDNFSQQQKKQFVSKLLQPIVKYQTGQSPNVYSEIHILNSPRSWEVVDQGGFGIISKTLVKFIFKSKIANSNIQQQNKEFKSNENIFIRQIVKKQDFHIDFNKLNHQKKILNIMKNKSSPFIAKFYYTQQNEYKNALLIQYCAQKSLNMVRLRNGEFMTLSSKLSYLKFIAEGIKFLKDHQIVHLDIKPTNLLFGFGIVKITDFGESFHPQICQKNYRPGTSIPYAPPESFSSDFINFNCKMDIFSFGVVMYEMLYEAFPFDFTNSKYDDYKKAYFDKSYPKFILQAPEKTCLQGCIQIHHFLKFLCLRCLDEDQRRRPCVEWIIIILQYCLNLQMLLYI